MSSNLTHRILDALATFTSAMRLYELTVGDGDDSGLLVEAFAADEALQTPGARDIIALSTSAQVPLADLLGQPASLQISLANGTRCLFPATSARRRCSAAMAAWRAIGCA